LILFQRKIAAALSGDAAALKQVQDKLAGALEQQET
jgi:hypothetical protein